MKSIALLFSSFLVFTFAANAELSDTTIIKAHFEKITKTEKPRNHQNIEQLNEVANYIKSTFSIYSSNAHFQEYEVNGLTYKNVICSFGPEDGERIIIGAHYDVCGNQEGADDNASGTIGLLELARLLKGKQLKHRVDLVAYTLEEPPYFRSKYMGSYVHAKYLADNKTPVLGMISLEMIAYFKDEKKSQEYPIGALSLIYGNKGNYITLVKKFGAGKFTKKFCRKFKSQKLVRTKKFTAPASLPGIDYSDHLNYWNMGFNALMITDTSFYRNKNYHEKTDTMETLDLLRMSKVIDSVYEVVLDIN